MLETEDNFVTLRQAKAYVKDLVDGEMSKPYRQQADLHGQKSPMIELKGLCLKCVESPQLFLLSLTQMFSLFQEHR